MGIADRNTVHIASHLVMLPRDVHKLAGKLGDENGGLIMDGRPIPDDLNASNFQMGNIFSFPDVDGNRFEVELLFAASNSGGLDIAAFQIPGTEEVFITFPGFNEIKDADAAVGDNWASTVNRPFIEGSLIHLQKVFEARGLNPDNIILTNISHSSGDGEHAIGSVFLKEELGYENFNNIFINPWDFKDALFHAIGPLIVDDLKNNPEGLDTESIIARHSGHFYHTSALVMGNYYDPVNLVGDNANIVGEIHYVESAGHTTSGFFGLGPEDMQNMSPDCYRNDIAIKDIEAFERQLDVFRRDSFADRSEEPVETPEADADAAQDAGTDFASTHDAFKPST